MTAIDRASYPHIFDGIVNDLISDGDYPALLACRLVSKELRDRIDTPLFEHVAVCRPQPKGMGMELRKATSPFQRLPYLPDTTAGETTSAASRESRERQLAMVTNLDYFGVRVDLERFATELKNLRVLRRPKSLDSPIVAPTFVDFRDATSRGGIAVCSVPSVSIGVRPGCKRLVLNVSYDAANTNLDDTSNRFMVHEGVKEMVLVYEPYPDTVPVASHANFGSQLGMLGGKLIDTIVPALVRGTKVTFVGVERMQPSWLRSPDDLVGQNLVRHVKDAWEELLRQWLDGDNYEGRTYDWSEEKIRSSVPSFQALETWETAAPLIERQPPQYNAPFCVDESLLVPGGSAGEFYEEWEGREAYERDPDSFWDGGLVNHRAIAHLGAGDCS